MALGIEPDARYSSRRFVLGRGEGLFLYTDGVTEAANPEQQLFSEKRLLACVAQRSHQPLEVLLSGIRNEVASQALDEPQSDDITMLGLRYQGAGAALRKASLKRPARAASPSRPHGRNGRSK